MAGGEESDDAITNVFADHTLQDWIIQDIVEIAETSDECVYRTVVDGEPVLWWARLRVWSARAPRRIPRAPRRIQRVSPLGSLIAFRIMALTAGDTLLGGDALKSLHWQRLERPCARVDVVVGEKVFGDESRVAG